MKVIKVLFIIIPLLQNGFVYGSESDPKLANSLDTARNVSVEFPSGAYNPPPPSTYTPPQTSAPFTYTTPRPYQTQPTTNYRTTQTSSCSCCSQKTTTVKIPTYATPRTPPTTRFTSPPTTRFTPPPTTQPTTPPTTKFTCPCWTQTPATVTTPRYTTRYTPPTTQPTTVPPRTTPPTTTSICPCWTQTTPTPVTAPSHTTSRTNPPIYPTQPPVRTTQFPGLANFVCQDKNSFSSFPNECDTYIECKEYVATKQICPEGLIYKPSTVWPAFPCVLSSEYQCLNGSITQPARPSAQCPHQDGIYPVPNSDCSQYIVCENGIGTLMNCSAGSVFNAEISACDWPINVPSCQPNALRDYICPLVEEAQLDLIFKYRYYNSCSMFVACHRGFPRLLSCDPGLRFDLESQSCIEEKYVGDCDV